MTSVRQDRPTTSSARGAWRRRCAGIVVGVVAATGLVAAAGVSTAVAQEPGTVMAARAATAPRFVSGYSLHCSQEMAADDVTGAEVDHVVSNYYLSARYDEVRETWRYPGPTLIVVLNENGLCVTVFRP